MAHLQDGYQYTITIRGFARFDPNRPESLQAALAHIQGKLIEAKRIGEATCKTKFRRRRGDGEDVPEAVETDPLDIPENMRRTGDKPQPEPNPPSDDGQGAPLPPLAAG